MPSDFKPMLNVGAGAYEIRLHVLGEWRVIYVAKFDNAVYVLHAFQKKTQKTRKEDIELAARRYRQIGGRVMNKEPVVESSGNVFADLGFSPEEATILAMRAELMARIRETILDKGWTQAEAAGQLGVGQSRISDLVRGKRDKFSLDMLVTLATRAGRHVELALS
jgi:predicted XRE-type DNA-binding protein